MTNFRNHISRGQDGGKFTYNKLFIVGNGFDLAKGLKSRYTDFMKYYFLKLISSSKDSTNSDVPNVNGIKPKIISNYFDDDLFHVGIKNKAWSFSPFINLTDIDNYSFVEIREKIINDAHFEILPKGDFSKSLLSVSDNWVDIESLYFRSVYKNKNKIEDVRTFNSQLIFIKKLLIEYLSEESKKLELDSGFSSDINKLIRSPLEIHKLKPKPKEELPNPTIGHFYFVNFNYTDILKTELRNLDIPRSKYTINNIHGVIGGFGAVDPINDESTLDKIIFGFGDESSDEYKQLLDLNKREVLENIKTYSYLVDENYDKLNQFINEGSPYQVVILGHSCQLSDKVLLNEIFKNDNCFSIKIYQHEGVNDYKEKNMNISRIIEDPLSLRNKVFRYDEKDQVPQVNKLA
jgi:hypothetical protein